MSSYVWQTPVCIRTWQPVHVYLVTYSQTFLEKQAWFRRRRRHMPLFNTVKGDMISTLTLVLSLKKKTCMHTNKHTVASVCLWFMGLEPLCSLGGLCWHDCFISQKISCRITGVLYNLKSHICAALISRMRLWGIGSILRAAQTPVTYIWEICPF